MNLAMTGVVNESQIREIVSPPVFLRHHLVQVQFLASFKSLGLMSGHIC